MEISYLNNENEGEWDGFVLESDSAWFRHTTDWQKYSACCRFDSNTKNFSFMVKHGSQILAVVPLLAEYAYPERNVDCFSMYGDYTPLPAFANNSDIDKMKVWEAINQEIRNIAIQNQVASGKFIIDPLIEFNYFKDFAFYNMLPESAQLNFSTTNIADLSGAEDVILKKMRKGHKSAIKQVLKDQTYQVEIYDSQNVTEEKISIFKEIHKIDAGKQTRTDASWDCMYQWIKKGYACLVMLYKKDIQKYCAAALIMTFKKAAYYASFATLDSRILNGHAGHIIQWEAIRYLKKHNILTYEVGDNYHHPILTDNDKKLYEISKYKRGFCSLEWPKITYSIKYS